MNRREFLVALGVAGCGNAPVQRPRRAPSAPRDPPSPAVEEGPGFGESQTAPSPLAFHGDLLVQSTDDELWFWDARTMTRIDAFSVAYRGFCFLQNGILAALAKPPGSTRCELHCIDANRRVEILHGPIFTVGERKTLVLPAGSPTEIYVTELDREVVLFRMTRAAIEERARIAIAPTYWADLEQLTSLGDGRLVARDGAKLRLVEPGKPALEYSTPGQHPFHLAPASGGRLWYSYTTSSSPASSVVLARLTDRLVHDARIDVAPGRVIHLATGGGAIAMLVHTVRGVMDFTWTVLVVDENGAERWRRDAPAELAGSGLGLNFGFVAISDHRVVLRGPDHTLVAWDAATGSRVR